MRMRTECEYCGCDEILIDASAIWNGEGLRWEIYETYTDEAYCKQCRSERDFDMNVLMEESS